MKQDDFEITWHRVKKLTGWKRQNDLGSFLGVTSAGISKAKREGVFREKWAEKIADEFDTTVKEILQGHPPENEDANNTGRVNHLEDPIITDLKLWLNELTTDDPDYVAWFRVELQNKFPSFKEWRQKKRDDNNYKDLAAG